VKIRYETFNNPESKPVSVSNRYKNIVRGIGLFFGGFVVMAIGTALPREWSVLYYSAGATITFMGATVIGFLMTSAQN
jgi:cytochrome c biogenesis protein CcdA